MIEYRDIPSSYKPGYRATSDGRIQSCWSRGGPNRTLTSQWHDLKMVPTKAGYLVVSINGAMLVHRLILEAFFGSAPEGSECCHRDGNPQNNSINNLRWDTKQANEDDKISVGSRPKGSRHKRSKVNESIVMEMRRRFELGGITKISLAREFGLHHSTVIDILSGKNWNHVGGGVCLARSSLEAPAKDT